MRFGIGQPITRKEDRRFLCGQGQFVADIDLARQTQAVFVYSPHAHGRILAVDTAAAEQAPGVRAVLTGAGWASAGMGCFEPEFMVEDVGGPKAVRTKIWPLALDRVRYVGERVAVVIADTEAQARDAAELVSVNYEVLPAIVDVANATRPDAPLVHDGITGNVSFTMSAGDAAATAQAFARAHHVTRLTLRNNRVTAFSMEPRGCVADFDRGTGRYTLYTSTQTVHGVRQTLARQIQQFRVHQHCTDDAVPRRRTTRGNLYHRAAGRSGGARASLRPGRTAAPESGLTRRVLYQTKTGLVYDSGDYARAMTRCQELADWTGYAARSAASTAAGHCRGRGMVYYIDNTGISTSAWNGCHICEVDIDPETGAVVVDRYAVVDDIGTVINPLLAMGQILGGIAQGAGQALLEEAAYDPASGQFLTGSLMDYAMPRADTLGTVQIDFSPVPSNTNPLGAKGAGEGGTVAATQQ